MYLELREPASGNTLAPSDWSGFQRSRRVKGVFIRTAVSRYVVTEGQEAQLGMGGFIHGPGTDAGHVLIRR